MQGDYQNIDNSPFMTEVHQHLDLCDELTIVLTQNCPRNSNYTVIVDSVSAEFDFIDAVGLESIETWADITGGHRNLTRFEKLPTAPMQTFP